MYIFIPGGPYQLDIFIKHNSKSFAYILLQNRVKFGILKKIGHFRNVNDAHIIPSLLI